jgi:DNA (cytosine-5)-methyltransferase 1
VLNGLSLFSGIGGIDLALSGYVRPIAYCEIDRYAQGVLLSRMREGSIDTAPIATDVRKLRGSDFTIRIDIIYGGFPCQDISVAGNGRGLSGERSGLFFEIVRLVREIQPPFVFLENVPAITTRGLDRIAAEFSSLRYDCRWGILSAHDVGAPHKRDRWFFLAHSNRGTNRADIGAISGIHRQTPQRETETVSLGDCGANVAHTDSMRELQSQGCEQVEWGWVGDGGKEVADASRVRLEGTGYVEGSSRNSRAGQFVFGGESLERQWDVEPDVGRVANGVPARVDRIRGLGNAVVPFQAREAFKRLMGLVG